MMSPCYKCTKRSAACHSLCEDYKEYRSEVDENNQKIKSVRDHELSYSNYKREIIYKMRKKYGK